MIGCKLGTMKIISTIHVGIHGFSTMLEIRTNPRVSWKFFFLLSLLWEWKYSHRDVRVMLRSIHHVIKNRNERSMRKFKSHERRSRVMLGEESSHLYKCAILPHCGRVWILALESRLGLGILALESSRVSCSEASVWL